MLWQKGKRLVTQVKNQSIKCNITQKQCKKIMGEQNKRTDERTIDRKVINQFHTNLTYMFIN